MTEKILQTKKNGMPVLLLVLLGYVVAIAAAVAVGMAGVPGVLGNVVMGIAIVYMVLAWILLCGLKVLKPQEALVLTLFGNYIGTLKGEGFYWVNPFCTAVNPAAGSWPRCWARRRPTRPRQPPTAAKRSPSSG